MDNAFKLLVAFLLENELMADYRLVFFTDDATCIHDYIEKFFGFRQYTIILDWLHLKKKCNEFLSMGTKDSKIEKQNIKKQLFAILWTGRYENAIKYLESVICKKNIYQESNEDRSDKGIYIPKITNYNMLYITS